jgi:hypothetical protein
VIWLIFKDVIVDYISVHLAVVFGEGQQSPRELGPELFSTNTLKRSDLSTPSPSSVFHPVLVVISTGQQEPPASLCQPTFKLPERGAQQSLNGFVSLSETHGTRKIDRGQH